MSRLLIFRHAHAADAAPSGDDFDRPLDERGRLQAGDTGAAAERLGFAPQRILCSPALRTRQTLEAAGPALADVAVDYPAALYHGGADAYLAAARAAGPADCIMLIGHNPGIGEFARMLVGDGETDAWRRLGQGFPKGALAVIEFEVALADIASGGGLLRHFLVPDR